MRSKMSSRVYPNERKRQKKIYIDKLKTLQKMIGKALIEYDHAKTCFENNRLDEHFHALQMKLNVVKRVFNEMQDTSKSLGKGGYLIGNFYVRKQSMMESSRRKQNLKYFITEIPESFIGELSSQNRSNRGTSSSCVDLTNPIISNLLFNPDTPHNPDIKALDDYEVDFDEESPSESPFDNLDELMKCPAHLAVFFHYLISNSNPSAFCLLIFTSDMKQLSKSSGLDQFLYSIYCTFLQDGATMKVDIDESLVVEVLRSMDMDKSSKKRAGAAKVLSAVHEDCKRIVQILLEDFRFKRLLGLGSLFGERNLRNNMDSHASDDVIDKSLWPHFEAFSKETWKSYSLCLVSCIVTFFKMFGFSPQRASTVKKLDSYTIFRLKNKSTSSPSTFPLLTSKVKVCLMKDHYFVAPKYVSEQNCHHCGRMVCSVGDYGLTCTKCQKHFHKSCTNLLEFNCRMDRKNKSKTDNNQQKETAWFPHTPGIPLSNKDNSKLVWNNNGFMTLKHLPRGETPSARYQDAPPAPGDPIVPIDPPSPESVPSSPGFHQTLGPSSSLQPFPEEDLMEEVTLRDTLCLSSTSDRKEFKKKSAVEEIVSSETTHVRFLKILYNVHFLPMLEKFPIDFVTLIFPNLHEVISVHDHIKNDFKTLAKEGNIDYLDHISKILLRHFSGERGNRCKSIFATFIQKQSHAIKILRSKQARDPELDNFIKDQMLLPVCHRLSLQDLLSKVMQRIIKYPMLIQNLIKLAHDCKPSTLETLERVHSCVEGITRHVNRVVHDFEMKVKLQNLQRRMYIKPVDGLNADMPYMDIYKDLKLTDYKLVHEGPLRFEVSRTHSLAMHVVLLENMIVLLRIQQQQFFETMTRSINSGRVNAPGLLLAYHSNLIIQGREDTRTTHSPIIHLSDLDVRSSASDARSFYLLNISKHGPQIYPLRADTPQEKKQWLEHLKAALGAYKDRKYKASFYFGIDSKRLKAKQKDGSSVNDEISETPNSKAVAAARNCDVGAGLDTSGEFSAWSSALENVSSLESAAVGRNSFSLHNESTTDRSFEDNDDSVFELPSLARFPAKSVDDLNSYESDNESSRAVHSMYMEFNKFMAALGEFLAENGSPSHTSTMSPRQLREWSNQLHVKFKGILGVLDKSHHSSDRSFVRSFSEGVTAA